MSFKKADNIAFWSKQMSEHCLFMQLGFVDDNLKKRAGDLHKRWENGDDLYSLINDTRKLKMDALKKISTTWIGWLFPSFIEHILLELDYFNDKLNNRVLSEDEEISFWNKIVGDHAGFTSHLLDPSEKELIDISNSIQYKTEMIIESEEKMWLVLSIKMAKELVDFHIQSKTLKPQSVIHPVLLDHVIREEKRAYDTLIQFK